MKFQIFGILALLMLTSSCLQTRSESGAINQSQMYRKKNVDNQSAEAEVNISKIDERDELIRSLNGRVDSLENQLAKLHQEKLATQSQINPDSQKIILLQEALSKMELQIQKLENEKISTASTKSSDANISTEKQNLTASAGSNKKQSTLEISETHFQKKEWKKAILSFQSYIEQSPKGKAVPEAKYKIGVCFQELGLKDEASAFYEEVLAQYPKAEFGKKAKIRLASLSSKKAAK